ncbi:FtsX-like permease family protein [Chitinophaga sp. 22321]|uniref:ABC transporter permease n=1 Tax=Chitinophaga hostae TaxID=2831022 RepID=A0ABS5IVX6_9BACT|nr:FtsX-like permease family protein [Chitinophaga hostae]MBS0027013.1 ABC transporter permease [Chitinophaga hostae]
MLENYLKTAMRSLFRNKRYTLINITGLTVGLAVCITIFILIRFETGYDDFHQQGNRVVRLLTRFNHSLNGVPRSSGTPFALPGVLKEEVPQVAAVAPIASLQDMPLTVPDEKRINRKTFKEKKGVVAISPAFFRVFSYSWLAGTPAALSQMDAIVLSRETATRYFGDWRQAMGKTVEMPGPIPMKVSGIVDIPANTEFCFKAMLPYQLIFPSSTDWGSVSESHQCYALLAPHADERRLQTQLNLLAHKYIPPEINNTLEFQPLSAVHLDDSLSNMGGNGINKSRIRMMWCIALLILLVAGVNFVNLSTAQAVKRAREAGVRKVLGGNNRQLRRQFLAETFILVFTAGVLALLLVAASLPAVGNLLHINLQLTLLFQPQVMIFFFLVTVMVTLAAGFYPAVIITRFNPVQVLKGQLLTIPAGGFTLRKTLVVFQFAVAQTLIIAMLVMVKQTYYFDTMPMGFEKRLILNVPVAGDSAGMSKIGLLHGRVAALPAVADISFSMAPPADGNNTYTGFNFNHAPEPAPFQAVYKSVDARFLSLYQMSLAAGRNVTATDSIREFMINETMVKQLGYHHAEDVLNKEIALWDGAVKGLIVGVVKDFNTSSGKDKVPPVMLYNYPNSRNMASVKLTAAGLPGTVDKIGTIFKSLYPNDPYDPRFLDDTIAAFYVHEVQLTRLYQLFAAIAVFLSCLGLYGLSSYMAVQRLKEVGIRKILGATTANIVYLFSGEFMLLVSAAFLLAAPLAWYFLHQWLQSYAYSTPLSWWVFGVGGAATAMIALITVGYHAVRSAVTNPALHLRNT